VRRRAITLKQRGLAGFCVQLQLLERGNAWIEATKDKFGDDWSAVANHYVYVADYYFNNNHTYPKDCNLYLFGKGSVGKSTMFLAFFFMCGLRGYKIRHDTKFDNPWADGLYDFAYSDDWDMSKTAEWTNSFTDPAQKDGYKVHDIRVAGAQHAFKSDHIPVTLISNRSPYSGKWAGEFRRHPHVLDGFLERFRVIQVSQWGNIWGLDDSPHQVNLERRQARETWFQREILGGKSQSDYGLAAFRTKYKL